MPRLPQPGGDQGNWGTILNDFLVQAHNPDGVLRDASIPTAAFIDGSITEAKLSTAVQTKLNSSGGGAVDSVNGQTGVVTLTKADIGLANADNTSDANKPISTATQTALDGKAATVHTHTASDVTSGTIAPARLGSGTADSTTFLRGDGTWETPSGGSGAVLLNGNGLPVSGTGAVGNYYLDKQNNLLYGPKLALTGDPLEAPTGAGNVTTFSNSSANDITLDKPANVADSDLLVALVNHRNEGTSFTTPAGWVMLAPGNNYAPSFGTWAVYYLAVPDATSLPASWTWTANGGPWRSTGVLFRVTGADLADPINIVGDSHNGNPAIAPSITTTKDNTLLIAPVVSNDGWANFFSAPGMTEIGLVTASGGSNSSAGVLQEYLSLATTTGSRTITSNVADRASMLFAINGASGNVWPVAIKGLPKGGTTGQVLAKTSNANFDVGWITP